MVCRSWRILARRAVFAVLLWSGVTSAQAAQHDLALTGDLVAGQSLSQEAFGNRYDQYFLPLGGLPDGGLSVAQGDTITATVTLSGPLTIPGSAPTTIFLLYLQNVSPPNGQFPDVDTATAGTVEFMLAGNAVLPSALSTGASTHGQLASSRAWSPDTIQALTFDQVVFNFSVTNLQTPAVVNFAQLSYSSVTPVPEPAEWALLAAGLAVLGAARRRARSTPAR